MTMLQLTDLGGNPIYFNVECVIVVRRALHEETTTNAHAALETYAGIALVQETVDDVIKKLAHV